MVESLPSVVVSSELLDEVESSVVMSSEVLDEVESSTVVPAVVVVSSPVVVLVPGLLASVELEADAEVSVLIGSEELPSPLDMVSMLVGPVVGAPELESPPVTTPVSVGM